MIRVRKTRTKKIVRHDFGQATETWPDHGEHCRCPYHA